MSNEPMKFNSRKPIGTMTIAEKSNLRCNIGDEIIHKGTRLIVAEILDYGSGTEKMSLSCCRISPSGKPLIHRIVYVGRDWSIDSGVVK